MSKTPGAVPFTTVKIRVEVMEAAEARGRAEGMPAPRVVAACVAHLAQEREGLVPTKRPRGLSKLRRVALRMTPAMLRARDELMGVYPSWGQAVEDAIVRHVEHAVLY